MLSISITHPDAEKFIDAKLEEGKVTGANISVKITDDFMKCVRENKDFIHVFPINHQLTEKQKEIINEEELGKIVNFGDGVFAKRNSAKKLWDKIIHNAWKSAEPGILYWDTIIRESLPDCYSDLGFKTTSTNPCQPSWATVLTPDGVKEFKDVNVGDKIWSSECWTTIVNKESSGVKPVYEYRTHLGAFIGTENHRIVSNGEKVEARYAKNIDSLVGSISQDINTADLIAVSKEKAYELQIILSSIGIKSVILDTDDNKYILRTIDNQSKEDIDKFNEIYKTEFISTEEVFNITVDNSTHTYWTGGLNVSNCGKLLPQTYSLIA